MLSSRQLLFMRRARDRTIGVAIAPIGTVALLPDPDFRWRVLRCVIHVGLSCIARWVGRMNRVDYQNRDHSGFSRSALSQVCALLKHGARCRNHTVSHEPTKALAIRYLAPGHRLGCLQSAPSNVRTDPDREMKPGRQMGSK